MPRTGGKVHAREATAAAVSVQKAQHQQGTLRWWLGAGVCDSFFGGR